MARRAVRLTLWLLALCVTLQGFGIAASRTAVSRHYHAGAGALPAEHRSAHEAGEGDHRPHDDIARHSHEASDTSVVRVEDDENEAVSLARADAKRTLVVDLDTIAPGCAAAAAAGPAASCWTRRAPSRFSTRSASPLERPPRSALS